MDIPKMIDTFPIRLLRAKAKSGMSSWELSRRAGLSCGLMSSYEQGLKKPSFETLIKLAYHLDVTTDYLCGLEKK